MNNLDPEKQEKLKECLKEERRMKEEEAKKEAKKNEEFAALKRAASFQYSQPRVGQLTQVFTKNFFFSTFFGTKIRFLFRVPPQRTKCSH